MLQDAADLGLALGSHLPWGAISSWGAVYGHAILHVAFLLAWHRGRVSQAWLYHVLSLPFWGKNSTVKDGAVGSWLCRKAEIPRAAQSMMPVLLSGTHRRQLGTGMGLPITALLGCLLTQAGLPAQPLGLFLADSPQELALMATAFPSLLPPLPSLFLHLPRQLSSAAGSS